MTTRTNLTLQQNFIELHWSERNWKLENHACRIVMHFWGRVNLRRRDKIKIKKKNNLLKAMWDTTENFILLAIGRGCSIYMSSHEKTTTRYNSRQSVVRAAWPSRIHLATKSSALKLIRNEIETRTRMPQWMGCMFACTCICR